jgi:hypothetical protein
MGVEMKLGGGGIGFQWRNYRLIDYVRKKIGMSERRWKYCTLLTNSNSYPKCHRLNKNYMRIPYGRVQGSGYNACTGKYCIICPGGKKNKNELT